MKIDGGSMSHSNVAETLERFVDGSGGRWEWDDFMFTKFDDSYLRGLQERMISLSTEFPPTQAGHYCSAEGIRVIRGYIETLKSMDSAAK
jgi:hypothetical protein